MNEQSQKYLLTEYAGLKQQIAILEDRIEELKPMVEATVVMLNPTDMTVEADGIGTFTMVAKRKYTYSPEVTEQEEAIKQAKKEEEATGKATYTESRFLKFISAKVE